jgi:quinohemoprotein ethanol dehydrogenase
MRVQLPVRSSRISFSMPRCAIALLCCAFGFEPLFAQEVDWAYNGHDVFNERYADIDQINPSNVSQLKVAWSFTGSTTASGLETVSTEATPLVVDGVLYVSGNSGGVFALNPATGKQIWHYTPSTPVAYGGNRGVAYGEGLIFDGQPGANLVALNAKTGAVVWKTLVDPDAASDGMYLSVAPQFILANNGTVPEVIIGCCALGDVGQRGHLDAYNPATGKLLWRFYTTEPNTWAGDSYLHGDAVPWQTPTFDPTLNMVYVGTGNAAADFQAVNREGANLYANSIVALDATTGELQWFFQMIHHDLWDFDCAQPAVLFSWNGIPAIEGTTKAGYTFILDRASGESLFPYEEAAVPATPANAAFQHPWPTQPVSSIESLVEHQAQPWYPVPAGATAVPEFTTPGPTVGVYQPALEGGYEWYSAAYSPRTDMIYSHAIYNPAVFGIENTFSNCALFTSAFNDCGLTTNPLVATPGISNGVYGAINTLTGKVAWSIPIITSTPASGMTVAGDLVFFADSTGLMYGVSASTGEILWVFDALTVPGAGGADSTGAAVYEINGVEYVVYEFGGSSVVQPFGQPVPGNALIAFALPPAVVAAEKSAASRARVK